MMENIGIKIKILKKSINGYNYNNNTVKKGGYLFEKGILRDITAR